MKSPLAIITVVITHTSSLISGQSQRSDRRASEPLISKSHGNEINILLFPAKKAEGRDRKRKTYVAAAGGAVGTAADTFARHAVAACIMEMEC
ncbi:MAG: hypothetical protein M1834_009278 [Cirrosporium novae-zelandiae]|nr:MAG: hypothetical protein M1834_009278 [Cirrosporium novae-zelandiae]